MHNLALPCMFFLEKHSTTLTLTYTHAHPTPMSTSKILGPAYLEIDEVITDASLLTGTSRTTERRNMWYCFGTSSIDDSISRKNTYTPRAHVRGDTSSKKKSQTTVR